MSHGEAEAPGPHRPLGTPEVPARVICQMDPLHGKQGPTAQRLHHLSAGKNNRKPTEQPAALEGIARSAKRRTFPRELRARGKEHPDSGPGAHGPEGPQGRCDVPAA